MKVKFGMKGFKMSIKKNIKCFWNKNKKTIKRISIPVVSTIGLYGAYRFGCQHGIDTLKEYISKRVPEAYDMIDMQYILDTKK